MVWAHLFKILTTQAKAKVGYLGALSQKKKFNSTIEASAIVWLKGVSLSCLKACNEALILLKKT